jgi:hypothetical protein
MRLSVVAKFYLRYLTYEVPHMTVVTASLGSIAEGYRELLGTGSMEEVET